MFVNRPRFRGLRTWALDDDDEIGGGGVQTPQCPSGLQESLGHTVNIEIKCREGGKKL